MESDRFSSEAARIGEFRRRNVRHVQCRACGYEPPREGTPARCPKCKGGCWETFVRVGKLRPAGTSRAHPAMTPGTDAIEPSPAPAPSQSVAPALCAAPTH
jgi:hypothetical protein